VTGRRSNQLSYSATFFHHDRSIAVHALCCFVLKPKAFLDYVDIFACRWTEHCRGMAKIPKPWFFEIRLLFVLT
jgi:hypothetical protein